MHTQNQICSMAIMIILLYLFLRQKRVGLYTEKVFLRTLLVAMLCVSLDILSLIAIHYRADIPAPFLDLICKSYIMTLIWVSYTALTYVITDLYTEKEYYKKLRQIRPWTILGMIIVYCLPIYYHTGNNEIYTEGPAVLATYLFAISFIIATIYTMARYGSRITPKRRFAVITWMVLWFLTAAVQFLNNQLLLVGLGCGLGMMALYCTLENPENNINHAYGCFHQHVLVRYLQQCYERKLSRSVMFISFISERQQGINEDYMDDCLRKLISWAKDNDSVKVFRGVERELAFVFSDMSEMSKAFTQIQEQFYYDQFYNQKSAKDGNNEEFPVSLFILFPDTLLLNDGNEVMSVRRAIYADNSNITSSFVCYANERLLEQIRNKKQVMSQIIQALEEDRVEVFYQPTYATKDKHFASAEALVRIREKDGTIIPPGQFIPIAEESGLISKLGERVFEKVCAFLKENNPEKLGIKYLEVNLSVIQCEQRNLSEHYLDIMKKYGIDPWYINLEITETGSVSSKNVLLSNMNRLIAEGVSFSLDDFGNGQSNLDYMIDMPVSIMKLDMNMTQSYFTDLKARFVVRATIQLAHELDLFVVAEGVETKEQLDEMIALGVDYIQGFYFSKPLPAKEYLKFLHTHGSPV